MPTRITPKQIDERKARIANLESRIEGWQKIEKDKGGDLWKFLGPRVRKAADAAKDDAIIRLTQDKLHEAKIAAGQFMAYDTMFSEVENTAIHIEKAQEEISLIRQQLKRAKEHDGMID